MTWDSIACQMTENL